MLTLEIASLVSDTSVIKELDELVSLDTMEFEVDVLETVFSSLMTVAVVSATVAVVSATVFLVLETPVFMLETELKEEVDVANALKVNTLKKHTFLLCI
jgi:hypothetical protein